MECLTEIITKTGLDPYVLENCCIRLTLFTQSSIEWFPLKTRKIFTKEQITTNHKTTQYPHIAHELRVLDSTIGYCWIECADANAGENAVRFNGRKVKILQWHFSWIELSNNIHWHLNQIDYDDDDERKTFFFVVLVCKIFISFFGILLFAIFLVFTVSGCECVCVMCVLWYRHEFQSIVDDENMKNRHHMSSFYWFLWQLKNENFRSEKEETEQIVFRISGHRISNFEFCVFAKQRK